MGDEDHRLADLAVQPDDLVLHVPADQRVERRERLVEEEHLRVHRQRPGQADALLHAAGELVGVGVLVAGEPDQLDRPPGPASCARPLPIAADLQPVGDVVQDPAVRQQPEVLEDHGELGGGAARAARLSLGLADVLAVEAATSPAVGSISRVRQRTSVDLPEPDRPMTTKTSPGAHVEGDVADGGDAAGPLLQLGRESSASGLPTTWSAAGRRPSTGRARRGRPDPRPARRRSAVPVWSVTSWS